MNINNLGVCTGAIGIIVWIISPVSFFPYSLLIGMIGGYLLGYYLPSRSTSQASMEKQ